MRVKVVYMADESTQDDVFTCPTHISRQLFRNGSANIRFPQDPGIDEKGNEVLSAQYQNVQAIYTYVQ